ncbi:hypothetical protein [Gordonia amicalis]|uniref:Uncharacterized protein n=1 Tax=Gordonia amicalis TaxID=89053 RepID=A0ABU4DJW0_9ACTN|nr:hypothetical protein [Gordonia amicalis]MDV6309940.1 hypothetical protein [Gordonia amicalis]
MSETMIQAAAKRGLPFDHVEYKCSFDRHEDGGAHCMFCEGGLFACSVCGSFEGATTTQCPKESMTLEQCDAVYAGDLDYRNGKWLPGVESFYSPGGYRQLLAEDAEGGDNHG